MKRNTIIIAFEGYSCSKSIRNAVISLFRKKKTQLLGELHKFIGFIKNKYKVSKEKTKNRINTIDEDNTLDSVRVFYKKDTSNIKIPKTTIDNDVCINNTTIGLEIAVRNAVNFIVDIKSTLPSNKKVVIVEFIGGISGYLTLYAGIASCCDIIIIPEKDYNLDNVVNKVKNIISSDKGYCIIAMSGAAKESIEDEITKNSNQSKQRCGASFNLARKIEEKTEYESITVILGNSIIGKSLITKDIIYDMPPLEFDNNDIIKKAKDMGIYFGD